MSKASPKSPKDKTPESPSDLTILSPSSSQESQESEMPPLLPEGDWDLAFLLEHLSSRSRQRLGLIPEGPQFEWCVVEIPDALPPKLHRFETKDRLVRWLTEAIKSEDDTTYIPYVGFPLALSQGYLRHLIIPGQDPVPLFADPLVSIKMDPVGRIDRPLIAPAEPVTEDVTGPAHTEPEIQEFVDFGDPDDDYDPIAADEDDEEDEEDDF